MLVVAFFAVVSKCGGAVTGPRKADPTSKECSSCNFFYSEHLRRSATRSKAAFLEERGRADWSAGY